MDVLFLLGKQYEPQIKSIGNDIVTKGGEHDLFKVYCSAENWEEFEESLSGFVRKMLIQKEDVKCLSYIRRIGCAKNDKAKLNVICELCFESFVLIKLFDLEEDQQTEEFELIRFNVWDSLKNSRPKLIDFVKSISSNNIIHLLIHEFPNSLKNINEQILEKIDPLLNQNDVISMEMRCQYLSDIWFVLLKITLTKELDVANNYIEQLPENMRSNMFNDLDLIVFETTFNLLKSFVIIFSSDALKAEYSEVASGLNANFNCHWKRQAILRILSNFRSSITQSNICVLIPLVNDTNVCSKIKDVFKFLINMEKKAKPSIEHIHRVLEGSNSSTDSTSDITIRQQPAPILDHSCSPKLLARQVASKQLPIRFFELSTDDQLKLKNGRKLGKPFVASLEIRLISWHHQQISLSEKIRKLGGAQTEALSIGISNPDYIYKICPVYVTTELSTLYKNNCLCFKELTKAVKEHYGMQDRSLINRIMRRKSE
ncbi:unnamed protein product [Caenorhabditis angaria]|uniref:Uncharacterized protein n=1 Tax=Caenorhabditis angaria TaxID=860376 RepID=A0A9P1I543_9PELO|nr:unnamed protein product [Caenorhabditis angaria]